VSRGIPLFETFLEQHRRLVYRFLAVAVGPTDVDDVFQETFVAALKAYPRLADGDRLDRWVLRIASRKAIDHHRGVRRRPLPVRDMPDAPAPDPTAAAVDASDPVWAAVRQLPPRQRVAIVHRHVLDRTYAEIGDLMNCSAETARAHVHQGTKRLRELMTWNSMH
jgi:RNA polymerase sigma factor (sigma-70 family)